MGYPATMRRAALGLVVVVAKVAPSAAQSTTAVQVEGGAEVDSNVQRVETGPGLETERIESSVVRLGTKLDRRGRAGGGGYLVHGQMFARLVSDAGAQSESVALLAGDLKWVRPIGERPVSIGFGVTGANALPLDGDVDRIDQCDRRRLDRTFATFGADVLLVMRKGDERSLTLGFGGRRFLYKPCDKFDWYGPSATARLDLTLWQPSGGTRSVELSAFAGVEARSYNDVAFANACADGEMPENPADCSAPTSLDRHDRFHRIGAEVTYVGNVVAALGYQLTVTDTNSYGQSLVRHRINLSTTTSLPWSLYGTLLVTIQYDQYLDGLIVQKDLQNQTFTTLDDENRSSAQVRLARQLTKTFSLESRVAYWRDIGGGDDAAFRRTLVYVGGVYNR
jgi:hypothetical protein